MSPLPASKATSLISSVGTCSFIMLFYPPPQLPDVVWIKIFVGVGFVLQLLYYHICVLTFEETLSPKLDAVISPRARTTEWRIRVFVLLLTYVLVFGWPALAGTSKEGFIVFLAVLMAAIVACYFVWDVVMWLSLKAHDDIRKCLLPFIYTDVVFAVASTLLLITIWNAPTPGGPSSPFASQGGFAVLCAVAYLGGGVYYLFLAKPPGIEWVTSFWERCRRGPYL